MILGGGRERALREEEGGGESAAIIEKELRAKRAKLARYREELKDGRTERAIREHVSSCSPPPTGSTYYHYHHLLPLDETIAYYKRVIKEHIIDSFQEDIWQLELRGGIIEP
jgi:hypothetical protein